MLLAFSGRSCTVFERKASKSGSWTMSEEIKSEVMTRRRALSLPLLGLAALSLTVPTMLTVSDAEAQTAGMQRRETRRTARQAGRQTRRAVRRGASPQ